LLERGILASPKVICYLFKKFPDSNKKTVFSQFSVVWQPSKRRVGAGVAPIRRDPILHSTYDKTTLNKRERNKRKKQCWGSVTFWPRIRTSDKSIRIQLRIRLLQKKTFS
jgi:hypothetical protein